MDAIDLTYDSDHVEVMEIPGAWPGQERAPQCERDDSMPCKCMHISWWLGGLVVASLYNDQVEANPRRPAQHRDLPQLLDQVYPGKARAPATHSLPPPSVTLSEVSDMPLSENEERRRYATVEAAKEAVRSAQEHSNERTKLLHRLHQSSSNDSDAESNERDY
uniref:Uncharacterized protein n=1 Tax=Trichogramma kaykai TaxID=54128 RepID=A0ABD2WEU3_9HYME